MCTLTGFGITMGYHRLWSHRSYSAHPILKILLAFFGAGASEGSILWWSKYHRLHHYKSDTEDDPYGPQKGFLYSHILWIFENRYLPKLNQVNTDNFDKWYFSEKNIHIEPFNKLNNFQTKIFEEVFNRNVYIYSHDNFYNL